MCNTVSDHTIRIAQDSGVILIFLNPDMSLSYMSRKVVAITYNSGITVLNDSETWVRSELKKMNIKIIRECKQ